MQVKRLVLVAVLVVGSVGVGGCGQRTLPQAQTYPVRGRILHKGQPASFVLVKFTPAEKEGTEAVGRTDKDGNFELRTFSNEGNDGGVPGEYKVTIEEFDPVQGGPLPRGGVPLKIPGGSVEVAQTYTIEAGDNDLQIEVP